MMIRGRSVSVPGYPIGEANPQPLQLPPWQLPQLDPPRLIARQGLTSKEKVQAFRGETKRTFKQMRGKNDTKAAREKLPKESRRSTLTFKSPFVLCPR